MTLEFKVYVLTWNVAEKLPPNDLSELLGLKGNDQENDLPDIYAIGLQEMKSNTTTLLSDSIFNDPWTTSITDHLSILDFVRIKSLRLVGIHLGVYVKRKHLYGVSKVESEFTRTGLGGLWGNKGGVSIRFEVNGVNMCFVNSHLSAHQENFLQRIEDYNQVVMSQKFRDVNSPNILDHDYVFWMGDLNFRLEDIDIDATKKKIQSKDLTYLLQHDQLNHAKLKELILIDFDEGDICFPPTYKFDPDTDVYDTSTKQRVPAWCDRILWRVNEDSFEGTSLSVQQLHYNSISSYKHSDHKPVSAAFTVKVLDTSVAPSVLFEPLSSWCRNKDQKVFFSILRGFPTSGRDWIGLYPSDFKHYEDYHVYSWLGSRSSIQHDDTSFLYSVPFEERFLDKLSPGKYIMLYFSASKNCVVSYSNDFRLIDEDESSSESEDWQDRGKSLLKKTSSRQHSQATRGSIERRMEATRSRANESYEGVKKFEEVAQVQEVFKSSSTVLNAKGGGSGRSEVGRTEKVIGSIGVVSEGRTGDMESSSGSKERNDVKTSGSHEIGESGVIESGGIGESVDRATKEAKVGGINMGSNAFEDAYMKLRDEGYKVKEKEIDDAIADNKDHKYERDINLRITEELDEETKRLRMQAIDNLILDTHLDNIADDFKDLVAVCDEEEGKEAGVIKAKKEYKLLVDESIEANAGGLKQRFDDEVRVNKGVTSARVDEKVNCDTIKITNASSMGSIRVVNDVDDLNIGLVMGGEMTRSSNLQDDIMKAYEGYDMKDDKRNADKNEISASCFDDWNAISTPVPDQLPFQQLSQYTTKSTYNTADKSIEKDLSLNDFQVLDKQYESFEDVSMATKMVYGEMDNSNNNKKTMGTTDNRGHEPSSTSTSDAFQSTAIERHDILPATSQHPFEDAYMHLRMKAMEEKGKEMEPIVQQEIDGDTEKLIEGMLIHQNLDDFSECLDLNPSGKMKMKEVDEERWKEESKGGDIKVSKHYDLLIKDQVDACVDVNPARKVVNQAVNQGFMQGDSINMDDFEVKMDPSIDNLETFQKKSCENKVLHTDT